MEQKLAQQFVELGILSETLQVPQLKKPRRNGEVFLIGAPGEIRTPDQVVRRHTYQLKPFIFQTLRNASAAHNA